MKNKVQFQQGYSLAELMRDYGSEEKCRDALFSWRWPNGYVCPACGSQKYCALKSRPVYQCNRCHHQHSLISGTIFAGTKLSLTKWFLAIHLITQSKSGMSALSLKRELGVSYNTAWSVKQKLMQVMKERDDSKPLSGIVQIDDAYIGGERHGGKRGRGSENKTPFIAAVSLNEEGHPVRMNLNVLNGFRSREISQWAKRHLDEASHVVSDGLACFNAVANVAQRHTPIVTGGGYKSVTLESFVWVNTMIGNVKNSITGTYHSVDHRHLPRYLAEFCYRFNRRFELREMLPRLAYAALRTPPMPGRLLKLAESHG